jgi:hypothetical protein
MKVRIEPRLSETMNTMIAVRRITENDMDEDAMRDDLLKFFSEEGLAEIQTQDGKPIWVATERLKQTFTGDQSDLFALMCEGAVEEASRARVTGSLGIILVECVDLAKKKQSAAGMSPEKITKDLLLLILSGSGKARLMSEDDGEMVWMASSEVFAEFNDILLGEKVGGLRMDDVLKAKAKHYYVGLKSSAEGVRVSKTTASCSMLQALERRGAAIAYRDTDGALAWKASDELQRDFASTKGKKSTGM